MYQIDNLPHNGHPVARLRQLVPRIVEKNDGSELFDMTGRGTFLMPLSRVWITRSGHIDIQRFADEQSWRMDQHLVWLSREAQNDRVFMRNLDEKVKTELREIIANASAHVSQVHNPRLKIPKL